MVSWLALIGQIALAIPMLLFATDIGGLIGLVVAMSWGLTTLYTAWSWVLGRWRVVLGPILFGLALISLLGSWWA